ncbi:MAG TPA: hypothetical protein VD902_18885 [Symbiobacteriaceae bacterium]|nr:hypothetical protein [Symbiobacteriaceae bacterium]
MARAGHTCTGIDFSLASVAYARETAAALVPGGRLLLEASTGGSIKATGSAERSWYTARSGLWSDRPHLALEESFWDEGAQAATTRHYVVDAESGGVPPQEGFVAITAVRR